MPRSKREIPCRDYALSLLSRQVHASGQLQAKLLRKGYDPEEVKIVLKDLVDLGLINDQEYAQTYFENLKKYRNFGFYGIKKKLLDKKVEKRYIDLLLKGLAVKDELEIANRLLQHAKNKSFEQKARMLQSRGFRSEVIQKILRNSQEDLKQD